MLKILVVDDDPEQRTLVAGMIARLGCELREAGSGVESVPIALDWHPDLILMDLMMPRQDGLVTCVQLREKGYSGHILLMTAYTNVMSRDGGIEAALECGANDFLQKPVTRGQLEKRLAIIEVVKSHR